MKDRDTPCHTFPLKESASPTVSLLLPTDHSGVDGVSPLRQTLTPLPCSSTDPASPLRLVCPQTDHSKGRRDVLRETDTCVTSPSPNTVFAPYVSFRGRQNPPHQSTETHTLSQPKDHSGGDGVSSARQIPALPPRPLKNSVSILSYFCPRRIIPRKMERLSSKDTETHTAILSH